MSKFITIEHFDSGKLHRKTINTDNIRSYSAARLFVGREFPGNDDGMLDCTKMITVEGHHLSLPVTPAVLDAALGAIDATAMFPPSRPERRRASKPLPTGLAAEPKGVQDVVTGGGA